MKKLLISVVLSFVMVIMIQKCVSNFEYAKRVDELTCKVDTFNEEHILSGVHTEVIFNDDYETLTVMVYYHDREMVELTEELFDEFIEEFEKFQEEENMSSI